MTLITIDKECLDTWNDMKFRKRDLNFIFFNIVQTQRLSLIESGKLPYNLFVEKFQDNKCCFAAVELPETSKLVLILWAPEKSTVRDRMLYATSSLYVMNQFLGCCKLIQATDRNEIKLDSIRSNFLNMR